MNAQEVAPVDLSAAMDPSKAGGLNERLVGCETTPRGCGNSFWTCVIVVVGKFYLKTLEKK